MNPLLSIVIPVKNGMPYIKSTIESVLSQDFQDYELIISNDASTDGTTEYLETLSDLRILVTAPPVPMKVDEHWTFACLLARGTYIKLLCADDMLTKGSLNRQLAALTKAHDIDVVVSSRKIVNKDGHVILKKHGRAGLLGNHDGIHVLRTSFLSGTNILGEPSGLIFKNSSLIKYLPWNNKYPYILDFELYSRLLISAKVVFIESIDSEFRIHGSSISSRFSMVHYKQFLEIYKELLLLNKEKLNFSYPEIIKMQIMVFVKTLIRQMVFRSAPYVGKMGAIKRMRKKIR